MYKKKRKYKKIKNKKEVYKIFPTQGIINKHIRSSLKSQKPICIWLTGRSGSGKTTLAQKLEEKLNLMNKHTYLLDGDNLRSGLNKDLGFTQEDRVENIRRVAEVSKLMVDSGLIVITAIISPFAKDRRKAKLLFSKDEFYEIFVNTPISTCIKRDPKNLYRKSKKNRNINNIGLRGSYEKPKRPFMRVSTEKNDPDFQVNRILNKIFT